MGSLFSIATKHMAVICFNLIIKSDEIVCWNSIFSNIIKCYFNIACIVLIWFVVVCKFVSFRIKDELLLLNHFAYKEKCTEYTGGCRGRDRMVVGFTSWVFEFRSWRGVLDTHYVIKFVSDFRQVGDFLQVLWFPPPIKLNATI